MTMSFVCWLLASHKYFAYTLKHELNTWKAMSGHDISLAITPAGAKRVLALTAPDIYNVYSRNRYCTCCHQYAIYTYKDTIFPIRNDQDISVFFAAASPSSTGYLSP